MTQPNFIISPEISRELASLAKKIPKVRKRGADGKPLPGSIELVSGDRMIKAGVVIHYGKEVRADKQYRLRTLVYENHQVNLVQNYQRDGKKGVKAYIRLMNRRGFAELSFRFKLLTILSLLKSLFKRKR